MHKFFVPACNTDENSVLIEGDDVKHIYKVLRLEVGEKININNCEGNEYIAKIEEIDKKYVRASILEKLEHNNESEINITLFQGMPKAAKMDLIVQKGTELGVKKFVPVITKRVVVKKGSNEFKKLDRWNRIALEACKQSKRSVVPTVEEPIDFQKLLKDLEDYDLIVVPYENQEGYGIKKLKDDLGDKKPKNVAIIIGPEGGFEEGEISILKDMGAYIVTLGNRILRTETAGFTCTTLIMYEFDDIGGVI